MRRSSTGSADPRRDPRQANPAGPGPASSSESLFGSLDAATASARVVHSTVPLPPSDLPRTADALFAAEYPSFTTSSTQDPRRGHASSANSGTAYATRADQYDRRESGFQAPSAPQYHDSTRAASTRARPASRESRPPQAHAHGPASSAYAQSHQRHLADLDEVTTASSANRPLFDPTTMQRPRPPSSGSAPPNRSPSSGHHHQQQQQQQQQQQADMASQVWQTSHTSAGNQQQPAAQASSGSGNAPSRGAAQPKFNFSGAPSRHLSTQFPTASVPSASPTVPSSQVPGTWQQRADGSRHVPHATQTGTWQHHLSTGNPEHSQCNPERSVQATSAAGDPRYHSAATATVGGLGSDPRSVGKRRASEEVSLHRYPSQPLQHHDQEQQQQQHQWQEHDQHAQHPRQRLYSPAGPQPALPQQQQQQHEACRHQEPRQEQPVGNAPYAQFSAREAQFAQRQHLPPPPAPTGSHYPQVQAHAHYPPAAPVPGSSSSFGSGRAPPPHAYPPPVGLAPAVVVSAQPPSQGQQRLDRSAESRTETSSRHQRLAAAHVSNSHGAANQQVSRGTGAVSPSARIVSPRLDEAGGPAMGSAPSQSISSAASHAAVVRQETFASPTTHDQRRDWQERSTVGHAHASSFPAHTGKPRTPLATQESTRSVPSSGPRPRVGEAAVPEVSQPPLPPRKDPGAEFAEKFVSQDRGARLVDAAGSSPPAKRVRAEVTADKHDHTYQRFATAQTRLNQAAKETPAPKPSSPQPNKGPGVEFAERFFSEDPGVRRSDAASRPPAVKAGANAAKRDSTFQRFTTAQSRLNTTTSASASKAADRSDRPAASGSRRYSPECEHSGSEDRSFQSGISIDGYPRRIYSSSPPSLRRSSSPPRKRLQSDRLPSRRHDNGHHHHQQQQRLSPLPKQPWADEFFATPAAGDASGEKSLETSKLRQGKDPLEQLLTVFRDTFLSQRCAQDLPMAAVVNMEEGELSDSDEEGDADGGNSAGKPAVQEAKALNHRERTRQKHKEFLQRTQHGKPRPGTDDGPSAGGGRSEEGGEETQQQQQQQQQPARRPLRDLEAADADGRFFAHQELSANIPGQNDSGKVCSCPKEEQQRGVLHGSYPGEKRIPPCQKNSNNYDRLFAYRVVLSPLKNFATSSPSSIVVDGVVYEFDSFLLIAHEDLSEIPTHRMIRYNIEYTLSLEREPLPVNFTAECLDVFHEFLFKHVLELYDWDLTGNVEDSCPRFHFYPRFVAADATARRGGPPSLLSMDQVLQHLVDSYQPLYTPTEGETYCGNAVAHADELVHCGHKKPSTIRLDRFEGKEGEEHPVICHFGFRPVQQSYAMDSNYQKLMRSYNKYQHQQFFGLMSRQDLEHMVQVKHEMESIRDEKTLRRDIMVELAPSGYCRLGLRSDIAQWALVLPPLVHQIRHYLSLNLLDDVLQYKFKDRALLAMALTHPTYHINYGVNPDHARTSLSNCGVREPAYGDKKMLHPLLRKRGANRLFNTMGKQATSPSVSTMQHYERLEFLGDAVLEYVCSLHLFLLFPDSQEGMLTIFRTSLVNNKHLAEMAEKLLLADFLLYAHSPEIMNDISLNGVLANAFEALLGAIFLEEGLGAAATFFARHAFAEDEGLQEVFLNYPLHALQQDKPCGDRELIPEAPFLQDLISLEDQTGIRFRHIRLLAKALTHPLVGYNNLTFGTNQRLEFLGDSVLQFAVSQYLYRHFPDHHEGHLTLLRSVLVSNRCLAKVSTDLGLLPHINMGKMASKLPVKTKLLADLFEAFIGALFVDRGMKLAVEVCSIVLFPKLPEMIEKRDWIDPKSKLQQSVLTLRRQGQPAAMPLYKQLEERGPSHNREYTVGVFFQRKRIGVGTGPSIQAAEMEAAEDALESRAIPRLRQMQFQVGDRSSACPRYD